MVYSLEVLEKMVTGTILELLCDCPQSFRSVPEEAVKHGYELLGTEKIGPLLRFVIRK